MRNVFLISILLLLIHLSSCKSNLTYFNAVPNDYYTRHHTENVTAKKREPILCLKESKKDKPSDAQTYRSTRVNIPVQDKPADFSVSKNTFGTFSSRPQWDIKELSYFSENRFEEENEEKGDREIEKFGFLSSAAALATIALIYVNIAYFATPLSALALPVMAALALISGIQSISIFKKNPGKYRGKGFAIFGLTISSVFFTFILIALISILAWFY